MLLYLCGSLTDLSNIEDLLNTYYHSLYNFMKQLGSDPDKIFPYKVFERHWKKYSLMGFMFVPYIMKFCFVQDDDINYQESNNIEEYVTWIRETIVRDKEYEDRVIGLCKRFFSNSDS